MAKSNKNRQYVVDESLHKALVALGLLPNEILLYTTSLQNGPLSIASLAAKLNLQRPNVYKVIAELEKHGLANFSGQAARKRTFVVEPPTVIKELLSNKTKQLNGINDSYLQALPSLLATYSQGEKGTKVKFYTYQHQWTQLFFDSLDEADGEIEWFGNYEAWLKFMPKADEELWIKKRIEKNIAIKLLLLPGKEAESLLNAPPSHQRECKIFNSPTPFDCSFQLYANKIIIWQPNSPLIVQIEDEYVVQMFRAMFKMMWNAR